MVESQGHQTPKLDWRPGIGIVLDSFGRIDFLVILCQLVTSTHEKRNKGLQDRSHSWVPKAVAMPLLRSHCVHMPWNVITCTTRDTIQDS